MPLLIAALDPNGGSVATNASWALGEIRYFYTRDSLFSSHFQYL
jgi:hypothetical protein